MNGRGSQAEQLWRAALTLSRRASAGKARGRAIPPLLFVTDPSRTPEPERVAAKLPAGAAIVYRSFGRSEALKTARILARIAHDRGLVLLIGQDEALAAAVSADGVHLPEREVRRAPEIRARRPLWLITGAAHGEAALRAAERARVDAALVSAVFESRSPSAGAPLGPTRFADLVRRTSLPVYALGGVTAATAGRLVASGASGLAAVEGLIEG